MSLKHVPQLKTIKARLEVLRNYLKTNPIGELPFDEKENFKTIFDIYYEPDEQYDKFKKTDITNVEITYHSKGTKCFRICINNNMFQNEWFPTTIKRLAGSNRTLTANLTRALRYAIESQIKLFRDTNILNSTNLCPIMKTVQLGKDAEVDHIVPFAKLANKWKQINNIKSININNIIYSTKDNYVLKEPYLKSWYEYHLKHAELRYLSKSGNKIAHKNTT